MKEGNTIKKIVYTNTAGESIVIGRNPPIYLEKIDANSLSSRASTTRAIGQDGFTTGEVTYSPRTVVLDIAYKGVDGGRMSQLEAERVFQTIGRTFILRSAGWLEYTNATGAYRIECRPEEISEPTRVAGQFYRTRIDLVADNPFWLSSQPFIWRLGSVVGGKRYPLRYPLRFGEWIKTAKIHNDTAIETPLTIEISGTADFILLTNTTTGEYIKVDHPVGSNQKMVIWTGYEPYVELITYDSLGNEVSREYTNYRLDLGSRYFKLKPGQNVLLLDNGIPNILPVAIVSYYKYHQVV